MQIMYVCTGNQCRSVMAEYYTRAKLADRGIGLQSGNITVRSAGTLHYPPHPADPMVIDLLKNDGIDANSHSSTPLTTDISRQADLILCFEREQISDLLEQNPLAIRKVFLFNDFVNACKHMHARGSDCGRNPPQTSLSKSWVAYLCAAVFAYGTRNRRPSSSITRGV